MCSPCCSIHHEGHIGNNAYWSEPVQEKHCRCTVTIWSLHRALRLLMSEPNTNHFWHPSASCPVLLPELGCEVSWGSCRKKLSSEGVQQMWFPGHCLCLTVLGHKRSHSVKLCEQITAARAESYYSYQTSYWFESNYLPEKALLNWERVYKVMARDFWKLLSVPDMYVLSPVRTCMKFLQSWEFNQVFSALLF